MIYAFESKEGSRPADFLPSSYSVSYATMNSECKESLLDYNARERLDKRHLPSEVRARSFESHPPPWSSRYMQKCTHWIHRFLELSSPHCPWVRPSLIFLLTIARFGWHGHISILCLGKDGFGVDIDRIAQWWTTSNT